MKTWLIFLKFIKELYRDIWALLLILLTTPFFVLLYWLITLEGPTPYPIALLDRDTGTGVEEITRELEAMSYNSGGPMFSLTEVDSREAGRELVRRQKAVFFVRFPEGFTRDLAGFPAGPPPEILIEGDLAGKDYPLAVILFWQALDNYAGRHHPVNYPLQVTEVPLGISASLDEFDLYIPGLLVLAVIMIIYSSAFMTAREIETKTIVRLRLTPLTPFNLVTGISLAQLVAALASLGITFLTARLLGFHSRGSLWTALLICGITAFSSIGLGIIVGCFSRTVSRSFLIASIPFIFLMFFSGSIFPLPRLPLFTLAGRGIFLFDFLPPTHAVNALSQIFIHGATAGDILFELAFITVLSLISYLLGIGLFTRKYFSKRSKQ